MSVTKLRDANTEPDEEVVAELENALDLARSGKLRTIVMMGTLIDNANYTAFVTEDAIEAIGQIELLKSRLIANMPQMGRP